ncbi:MAG: glycosyltransferase family 39 protein [Patescibacteria group bacterium]
MGERLGKSIEIVLLVIILTGSSFLSFGAALHESAIMDELAHIPAGYSYVKYLDFRLNPEHPPLIKALSAVPLLTLDLNFPLESDAWKKDVNGQWDAGSKFLYESGNDPDQILRAIRVFPIVLTMLTTLLIYIWSKELLGKFWSLLPPLLFAFSPTVLAHGHYVTTDVGAAFGLILSTYFFVKFLLHQSNKNLIISGITLGIAELTKFSMVLLIPYFLIIAFVFYLAGILRKENGHKLWHYIKSLFLIFVIALIVIYSVYFVFTLNYPIDRQVNDTTAILQSFSPKFLADANIYLSGNRVLRPLGEYFLGVLMVLQRSSGGNTNYFLGEVGAAGSHLYFPIVFLLKEPLPYLILILFSLALSFKNIWKKVRDGLSGIFSQLLNYLGTHFSEFALLTFFVIYWAYSIKSPLNIGFRHLMPTLPLLYILVSCGLKSWFSLGTKKILKSSFLALMLVWGAGEVAISSPYFLSYFNEVGGGTWGGYKYATDSNYDWGQDLKQLQKIVEENNIKKIAVDYFGAGNPKYYLGQDTAEYWWSALGNPKEEGIEWLAVSINTLQGAIQKTAAGFERKPEDGYEWLIKMRPPEKGFGQVPKPDFRAGTSIFVYHL